MNWTNWLNWSLIDRPLANWVSAAAVALLVLLLLWGLRRVLSRRCESAAPGSWRTLICGLNSRWLKLTSVVIAIAIASPLLYPSTRAVAAIRVITVVVLVFQTIRLTPAVVEWSIARLAARADHAYAGTAATLSSLRWLILAGLYALILLLGLQNMGIDVTAMIAGLGIGGIAIALAAQNILGDLFGSLTIALDKPFVPGDFIVVGQEMGTVEHVGLKTTRVRSLSGEQLVFGNADLLASRIRNFKRMSDRRVVFNFGVVQQTPPDVVEQIPAMVRQIIQSHGSKVTFDRCHFSRFGDNSLDFEAVYILHSADFNTHMDTQQAILLAIARELRERHITIAQPTQTLLVNRQPLNAPRHARDPHEPPSPPSTYAPSSHTTHGRPRD